MDEIGWIQGLSELKTSTDGRRDLSQRNKETTERPQHRWEDLLKKDLRKPEEHFGMKE